MNIDRDKAVDQSTDDDDFLTLNDAIHHPSVETGVGAHVEAVCVHPSRGCHAADSWVNPFAPTRRTVDQQVTTICPSGGAPVLDEIPTVFGRPVEYGDVFALVHLGVDRRPGARLFSEVQNVGIDVAGTFGGSMTLRGYGEKCGEQQCENRRQHYEHAIPLTRESYLRNTWSRSPGQMTRDVHERPLPLSLSPTHRAIEAAILERSAGHPLVLQDCGVRLFRSFP